MFSASSLIYPVSVFLVALFFWSVWSWKIVTKSIFDPYILFFIPAMLFNGGQAMLEVIKLNEYGFLNNRFSSEIVVETLFLVMLGLASLHFGALTGISLNKRSVSVSNSRRTTLCPNKQDICMVGWGLLFLSFIPSVYLIRQALDTVFSGGYSALYQKETATGFSAAPRVLATFLVPSALFLLAGSGRRRVYIVLSGFIIMTYSAIYLFLGYRAYSAMALIAYAWLWHRCIHPIPMNILTTAGGLLLFIVFPLVKFVRNLVGGERLSLTFLIDSFISIDAPVIAIMSEIGGSMRTIAHTLQLVPSFREYDFGIGYLYALLTIFPNAFWDIHPSIAHGTLSDWLVWAVAPATAVLGGGLGFSFIAEAYLNFGWVGTPIVLGLIGFLLGKIVLWVRGTGEASKLAMVACFLSFFLAYSRGEATSVIRPLFWYSLLPYFSIYVIKDVRKMLFGKYKSLEDTATS
jgi:oligosaccharide repeat unit polymerase